MNNILKVFSLFLVLGFLMTSCGSDTITPTIQNPTISFNSASTGDITVNAGEEFSVTVTATKNANDLKSVTVYENGTVLPLTDNRLKVDGVLASSNPILLFGSDKSTFTKVFTIKVPSTSGSNVYKIEVADEGSNVASVSKNVTVNATPPTLTYKGASEVNANPDSKFVFKFDGVVGGGKLSSIEVREDDVKIADLTRLTWGSTAFTANPHFLGASDENGFTDGSLYIKIPNLIGKFNYTVILTDVNNLKSTATFSVVTGTAATVLTAKLLKNAGGPAGTGGIDLDTGESTGSSASGSEVKDNGIVNAQTDPTWKQKISGIGSTNVLKKLNPGSNDIPTGFNINAVNYTEELPYYFSKAASLTNNTSDVVAVGDIFMCQNSSGKYFMFEITKIVVTTTDNADYYEMTIKQ